jgi:hypothetical protein
MARRGRKRVLDREVRFWELLSAGVGPVEACRQVSVSRKTGYRWRAEMGGVTTKKQLGTRAGIYHCSSVNESRRWLPRALARVRSADG